MSAAEKGFKLDKKNNRITFSVRKVIDEKLFLAECKSQMMLIVLENYAQTCLLLVQINVAEVSVQESIISKSLQTSKNFIGTGVRFLKRGKRVPVQDRQGKTEPVIRFTIQQLAVGDRCYAIDGPEQTLTECSEFFKQYALIEE